MPHSGYSETLDGKVEDVSIRKIKKRWV